MKKPQIIISICFILVIVSITFIPSLNNNFTNWDDGIYVTDNATIRNLYWRNIKNIFTSSYTDVYVPLSFLTLKRCKVWKDSITLWNNVIKNYPNMPIAYTNRGNTYNNRGEYDKAWKDVLKFQSLGYEIDPEFLENFRKASGRYQ